MEIRATGAVIGATLIGVLIGFFLGRTTATAAETPKHEPDPLASMSPKDRAVIATIASREGLDLLPPPIKEKDPETASPLYGFLSPEFTTLPVPVCPPLGTGPGMCPYTACAASVPQTQHPGKLWNAYVVSGKDGPMLVCEWREKL